MPRLRKFRLEVAAAPSISLSLASISAIISAALASGFVIYGMSGPPRECRSGIDIRLIAGLQAMLRTLAGGRHFISTLMARFHGTIFADAAPPTRAFHCDGLATCAPPFHIQRYWLSGHQPARISRFLDIAALSGVAAGRAHAMPFSPRDTSRFSISQCRTRRRAA